MTVATGADLLGPTWPERNRWPLLGVALALGFMLTLGDDEWLIAVAIGSAAALAMFGFRERHVPVAVGAALVTMVLAVAVGEDLSMLPLVGYAAFYLAYEKPSRISIPVGGAIAVALGIVVPVLDRERLDPLTVVGVVSVVLVPLLLGVVLRQQEEQVRTQVEAATASRVEQERLAIARDLHDIVAHGLTAVAIQSGTAIHLFDDQPEQAREALANVNEASRSALAELRAMVGQLRSAGSDRPSAAADPVAAAITRIAPAMPVTVRGDELPEGTPSTVRIALERVTGEALANVIAHGGSGPTTVELIVEAKHLELTIDNDQGSEAATTSSTGFGIMGMTERVAALGGILEAGPRANGFTVMATIPRGEW